MQPHRFRQIVGLTAFACRAFSSKKKLASAMPSSE
jgi:hypothetical protein